MLDRPGTVPGDPSEGVSVISLRRSAAPSTSPRWMPCAPVGLWILTSSMSTFRVGSQGCRSRSCRRRGRRCGSSRDPPRQDRDDRTAAPGEQESVEVEVHVRCADRDDRSCAAGEVPRDDVLPIGAQQRARSEDGSPALGGEERLPRGTERSKTTETRTKLRSMCSSSEAQATPRREPPAMTPPATPHSRLLLEAPVDLRANSIRLSSMR